MDRKKIIQIVVIIIAFGASGFVLYNGLYKPKTPLNPALLVEQLGAGVPGAASPDNLLPHGKTFDIAGVINPHNFQFDAISFPKLSTSTEVGLYDEASKRYLAPLIK